MVHALQIAKVHDGEGGQGLVMSHRPQTHNICGCGGSSIIAIVNAEQSHALFVSEAKYVACLGIQHGINNFQTLLYSDKYICQNLQMILLFGCVSPISHFPSSHSPTTQSFFRSDVFLNAFSLQTCPLH